MHPCNAIGALLLIESLLVPSAVVATAQTNDHRVQICWSLGKFDQTVYFAETQLLEDRKASFAEMLDISAIDHSSVECNNLDRAQRNAIMRRWLETPLEIINTTFLSDMDY
jgi:UDP-N-acetylglucosamine transferase subunit ALG13